MGDESHQGRLIGRDAECARIDRILSGDGRSRQRCVVVSGEPGIGKTALLRHLAHEATRLGHQTLFGAGSDLERDVPFGLMIDALDDRLRDLDERYLARICGSELSEVALVFPTLAHLSAPSTTRLQEERYRVHRALRRLLEGLAAEGPLTLILDDVHWADRESVEFLGHLLRHPVREPLLVTLAMRTSATPDALKAAVRAGGQDARVQRLRVGPLAREAMAELVGPGIDDHTLARLYSESGGNPLYASALSGAYRRGQALRAVSGRARFDGAVPAAVVEAVASELDALPEGTSRILQAAAIVGDGFDAPSVADVVEARESDVELAFDAAAVAGVIVGDGPGGRFRFRHPIVRGAAYESASPVWRRRLHARAAARLRDQQTAPGSWAHHLAQSAAPGDMDAVDALRRAAHSVRLTAPGSAAHWLTAALGLLRGSSTAQRLDILVPLAMTLAAAGELEEARRILRQTLPLAGAGRVVMRGRMIASLAVVEHMLGSHDAATELLEHALAALDVSGADSPEAAVLRLQLAWDHLWACDPGAAVVRAREARVLAGRLDDSGLAAATAGVLALTESTLGRFDESSRALADGLAIASELTDEALAAHLEATMLLGFAAYNLDRLREGGELVERGIAISRASERGQFYVPMLLLLGLTRVACGDLASADVLGRDAEDVSRLANNTQWLIWSLTVQSATAMLAGDLPRAVRCAEEAVEVGSKLTRNYFSLLARSFLAAAVLEAGDPDRCVSELLAICGDPDLPPLQRPFRPVPYEVLTRAEIARGNFAAAAEWARRATFAAQVVPIPSRRSEALRSEAEIALVLDEPVTAARLARLAVAVTKPGERALDTARSELLAGTALQAAGDRTAALEQLHSAQQGFQRCGAQRLDDAAASRLRSLGRRVARGGRPSGANRDASAPSRRERQIGELVGQGKTNRQIAGELFISEKTVEGHVAKLFDKLGVSRRAAIAAALEVPPPGKG